MPAPHIVTERLLLTWPNTAPIDAYHAAIIGSSMFDTIAWDGPTSDRDLHDYWQRMRDRMESGCSALLAVAIVERVSGEYVGGVALRPVVEDDGTVLDLGYALAPRWHGKGYATEAVRALVHEGFERRGAERIFASVFVGNTASRRVAEKAGLRLEGTLRRAIRKRGVWLDEWVLAIIRPDWEAER